MLPGHIEDDIPACVDGPQVIGCIEFHAGAATFMVWAQVPMNGPGVVSNLGALAFLRRLVLAGIGIGSAVAMQAFDGLGILQNLVRHGEFHILDAKFLYPRFRPIEDEGELERVRRRYSLDEPFILSLGTLEPRKNYVRLIEACAQLRRRLPSAPSLIIAGGHGWLYEDILAAAKRHGNGSVRSLGFVPDEDLPALYTLAELFAFPSLYEGFGLPPLEAMACGTPVVCSNRPSLPETAGDAALMVDAEDIEGLATAMQRALEDEKLRTEMIAKGLAQANRFTWKKAAEKLLDAYRETLLQ